MAPPFRAVAHDRLPSTSDEAKRLALAGAAHGTMVWAQSQTGGRGRHGRHWVSPPGNLYVSAVLRPAVAPARAAELSFVGAVAVAECVAPYLPAGRRLTLKWPNDVLVDGAKLAGLLLETQAGSTGPVEWVVLGIGINVASAPADMPYPAACLGPDGPSVEALLGALAAALARIIALWQAEGFAPIRERWLARAHGLGEPARLDRGGEIVTGRFETIDSDGAMVLATEAGRRRVTAGEVSFAHG